MSRPLIGNKDSWSNFEKCVLETITVALINLCDKPSLPINEDVSGDDSLNRRLYISLHKVVKDWEDYHEIEYPYPFNLKRNSTKQPDLENEEIVNTFETKIPDFQWGFTDRSGNGHKLNEYFKNYDIECKRLGASRSLSKEYVINGIIRFTKMTHRYGQYTSSGMMIGFIQDRNLQIILDEVNSSTTSKSLPEILLSPKSWEQEVSRLDHKLERPEIEPSPFELRHLWVDLRHHYEQKITSAEKNESNSKKQKVQKPKSSKVKSNNE